MTERLKERQCEQQTASEQEKQSARQIVKARETVCKTDHQSKRDSVLETDNSLCKFELSSFVSFHIFGIQSADKTQ